MPKLDPSWKALKDRGKSGISHLQTTVRVEDVDDLNEIGQWLVKNKEVTGVTNNTAYAISRIAIQKFKEAFTKDAKEDAVISRW
jgi:hypothetical protein